MSKKKLKEVIGDTFFGATGAALSKNQLQHTVIKRDIRLDAARTGYSLMFGTAVAKPAFFMPFESGLDIVTKIASIPLAPGAFLVEALANALVALSYALMSVFRFCILDWSAKDDFLKAGTFLLSSGQAFCAAILSPLLNLIDFLGSSIMTACEGFSDENCFETHSAEVLRSVRIR